MSDGSDTILVIIDRLTKQLIFIPAIDTITSPMLAKLFILHIFSKHGVPSHVTSDRSMEFISTFFHSLGKVLDMKLHFTLGYHPEGNGQTERANQTHQQYLWVYCNYQQSNWSDLLPIAEFAYNNAPNTTTGLSPFYANKGYHPNLSVHPKQDVASTWAWDYVVNLDKLHRQLHSHISDAQKQYSMSADKHWTPSPDFKIGDKVFIKSDNIHTTWLSKKLAEKFLGPFEILAQVGSVSFTLRLPDSMRGIHPIFHISMLEPSAPNEFPNQTETPPPLVIINGEMEFEISEILDSKIGKHHKCRLQYLVKWSGYEGTDEETSWILTSKLKHATESMADFHLANLDKPGPSSS